jgi:hypothetical protein
LLAKAQNRKVLGFFAFAPQYRLCAGCWITSLSLALCSSKGVTAEQSNARSGPRIFMIDGLVAGRLYGETEQRTDKAGKTFTLAKVRASTADGELLFVNVIAFDAAVCAEMRAMQDGDSVALSGSLSPRVWTDKQGNARPALDMVAHRVIVSPGIGG